MGKTEALTPLILLQDNPCEQLDSDHLSLKTYATIVASAAVGNDGPFTIGVFGDWGTGKTSLLHLAEERVRNSGQEDTITVWFNAWQHEREEEPLFSLLGAILDAIELDGKNEPGQDPAKKKDSPLKKIGHSIRALTRGMKFKGDVGIPLIGSVGIEFDAEKALKAEEILGADTNPLKAEMMYTSAFQLLREEAKKNKFRIIVFIDDLDRCDPEKAVHLLESIKLILNQKGFVFVLALAHTVVTKYLDHVYVEKYKLDQKNWGEFYLQKIINLPIELPHHGQNFKQFANDMVGDLIQKYKKQIEEQVKDKKLTPKEIEALIPNEVEALKTIAEPLAGGAQFNPRSFVRHANKFLVNARLWQAKHEEKAKSGNTTGISNDDALLIAVDTILESTLTASELYELARNNELCEQIFKEVIGG